MSKDTLPLFAVFLLLPATTFVQKLIIKIRHFLSGYELWISALMKGSKCARQNRTEKGSMKCQWCGKNTLWKVHPKSSLTNSQRSTAGPGGVCIADATWTRRWSLTVQMRFLHQSLGYSLTFLMTMVTIMLVPAHLCTSLTFFAFLRNILFVPARTCAATCAPFITSYTLVTGMSL